MGASLREVFTPLFSYVVLLARTPSLHQRGFADLRGDVRRLLDEQQALVKRHDIPAADYDAARFAAVAWTDELLVRFTHESSREISQQWKRSPLQVELYDTANAGEEFYTRLDALRPAQKDVREIYHLCLCLGFRGRYYDDTQEFKIVELRRQTGQHLPLAVPDLLEVEKTQEKVTPQPYQVQPPAPRPVGGRSSMPWIAAALALAACVGVIAYLMWPSGRSAPAIIADIRQRVAPFTCWKLEALDFNADKGLVTLAGRVESDDQRQQIRKAVKGVPEVKRGAGDVPHSPATFLRGTGNPGAVRGRRRRVGRRAFRAPAEGMRCDVPARREPRLHRVGTTAAAVCVRGLFRCRSYPDGAPAAESQAARQWAAEPDAGHHRRAEQ